MTTLHKIITIAVLSATVVIIAFVLSLTNNPLMVTIPSEQTTIRNDGGIVSNGVIFETPIISEDSAGASENHGKHTIFKMTTTYDGPVVPVTPKTLPPTSTPKIHDCVTAEECAAASVYGNDVNQINTLPAGMP